MRRVAACAGREEDGEEVELGVVMCGAACITPEESWGEPGGDGEKQMRLHE